VEVWLQRLKDSVAKTLRELNINIIQDCNNGVMMDEWAAKVGGGRAYSVTGQANRNTCVKFI
jgi:hypothetical protein